MARGQVAKAKILEKILQTFEGSFMHEKELRIPIDEDGYTMQIKITATAAKDIVTPDGEVLDKNTPILTPLGRPKDLVAKGQESEMMDFAQMDQPKTIEPNDEEKENVKKLLEALNF